MNEMKNKFFPHTNLSEALLPPCHITNEGMEMLKSYGSSAVEFERKDPDTQTKLRQILGESFQQAITKKLTENSPVNALDALKKKNQAKRGARKTMNKNAEKMNRTDASPVFYQHEYKERKQPILNFSARIEEISRHSTIVLSEKEKSLTIRSQRKSLQSLQPPPTQRGYGSRPSLSVTIISSRHDSPAPSCHDLEEVIFEKESVAPEP